jgi:GntR family transcriptional regulator, rspAB operon transcriptional repressor
MPPEAPQPDALDLTLPTIERRRATDEVYDVLRRSILTNVFQPGQRLPVDDIARKLGVSLTPVRHAIQQLATEGLIEIRPRSGTFVASLDIRDIAETFDIRRALECLAAEGAAAHINDEQLRRARRLVWALSEPVETDDDRTRHEANNSEFHRLLIEASGNRRLAEMYESLKAHLQIARVHSSETSGHLAARLQQEQAEHENIMDALENRDAGRLIAALSEHIDRAKTALMSLLQEPGNA